MWSTYIMDLLLLLANYGEAVTAGSHAACVDFNGHRIITINDFLEMLSQQPPINKE